ncbi:MAG: chemotaxis protein CheW [Pseudobdellovibrionaceae bacterium]
MSQSSRYLCFNLGKEEFAIPLLAVKEVIGVPETTPIPQSPPHFTGIMNLRGQVISIVDLRVKLVIKPTQSAETSVIILDLGEYCMGAIVDKVNSVQLLASEEIADRPLADFAKNTDYIKGVFRKEDNLILILDISKALSIEDKNVAKMQKPKAA